MRKFRMTFLFILILDLIIEDTNLPWFVHVLVLAISSTEFVGAYLTGKKKLWTPKQKQT